VGASAEQLIETLAEAGLVTGEESAALRAGWRDKKQSPDGEKLAKELVRQGKLTRYQAAAAYQRRIDRLVLGNYVLLDQLGAGAMGQVYRARHRRMDRVVALKVLSRKLLESPAAVARFEREVKAAARLVHPNIVTAYDADQEAETHFLVMEYVEGCDLATLVKRQGPLPVAQATDCIIQAAKGLEHAHAEGVIHRDIKPSNLLLDKRGMVKVLDMGLALLEAAQSAESGASAAPASTEEKASIIGTPEYLSPEQATTRQADARSDIYSLGCTWHYLLTGRPPFEGANVRDWIRAHQQAAIPAISAGREDVSPAMEAAFRKMLAKQPAERFQTMREVIVTLTGCLAGQPVRPIVLPAIPAATSPTLSASENSPPAVRVGNWQIPRKAALAAGATLIFVVGVLLAAMLRPGSAQSKLTDGASNGESALPAMHENAQPPRPEPPANGYAHADILNCHDRIYEAEISPGFDVAKSWRLSLEFRTSAFVVGLDELFHWGDKRIGRDPIYVRLDGQRVEAGIGNAVQNKVKTIRAPLFDDHLSRWVAVQVNYNAATNEMALYIDGKLVKRLPCGLKPAADQPMPLYLGGDSPTTQRFKGELRRIWLGNEDVSSAK
jgi:serine/threonine protein kinase